MEALRRRVEELELENALMREVVEVVKKDPGADLRRLSNREKTMLIDRLRPRYSLRSMACLLRIAPSCFASMFVRQVRQCFSAVWADGFPRCRHRFPVM